MSEFGIGEAGEAGGAEMSVSEIEAAAEHLEGAEQAGEAAAEEAVEAREPLPHEEVERRWRQTQTALRESRSDLRALRAELAQLKGGAQASAPPDAQVDPIGAVHWMQQQFVATQQQQQVASFVQSLESQEAEVATAHPDYFDALEFLRQTRRSELMDLGAPDEAVDQIVAQEFMQGVTEARRQGLNPAKVALKLARERGFARRGALGNIEAGAAAARTLSASGGRGGHEGGTLEQRIANLSGQALRDAWRRHKATTR